MRVKREDLLAILQVVEPALSKRDMIEQSNCFLFKDGKISASNGEMIIRQDFDLDFEGAVEGRHLLDIVQKLTDDELDIAADKSSIKIKGVKSKRRLTRIRMKAEIAFDFGTIKLPKNWIEIPDDFTEAITTVRDCAGKEAKYYSLTCVHIHPNWIECFDNFQAARFQLEVPIKEPILVPATSIEHIINMTLDSMGITESWIHFKSEDGLQVSCRTDNREFPDTTKLLKSKGDKFALPEGMQEVIERAQVFSSDTQDEELVIVSLGGNIMTIRGEGAVGFFREKIKVQYKKEEIQFLIPPEVLKRICANNDEIELSKGKMIARRDKWTYVTALAKKSEGESDEG